jgi:hypothetical protein
MFAGQVVCSLPLLYGKAERLAERRTKVSKKVSDILPKTEILAQLAEEASELAQAALKLRRALDGTNPTPKSVAECEENLLEEWADVNVAFDQLWDDKGAFQLVELDEEYQIAITKKLDRWLSRLEAKENKNG